MYVNHRNKHTKMMHITNLGIHASSSLRIRPSIARKWGRKAAGFLTLRVSLLLMKTILHCYSRGCKTDERLKVDKAIKPPAAACSRCREDDASGRRSFHLFCQEKLKDAVAGLKRKWSAETRANVIALLEPWISCDEETKTSCCTICYCYLKEDAGLQLVTVEPVVSDEEYLPLLLTV